MAIDLEKLREQLARRFSTDTLDDFRAHFEISLRRQSADLAKEVDAATASKGEDPDLFEAYRSHLDGLMDSTADLMRLCSELSIVALYRQVESHLKRVLRGTFPKSSDLASASDKLKAKLPFITMLPHIAAFDELRLLNNDVKHGDGRVSDRLAKAFPGSGWVEGEPLSGLEIHFVRLEPLIKAFVDEFVTACYDEMRKAKATAAASPGSKSVGSVPVSAAAHPAPAGGRRTPSARKP